MAKIVQTEGRTSSLLECYAEVQPIFCKDTKKIETTIPFNSIFLFSTQRLPTRGCSCLSCTNKANYRRVWHPAIPTQPPNNLPTEATQKRLVEKKNLCASVKSVGGYSLPKTSVGSACSVGEPYAAKPSVRICGRLFSAIDFCGFCVFRGRTLRSQTICAHPCASVGGSSPPEVSVNSVNSVGEPYAA